ncbi:hypothetical protein [Actinoplanes sp. NPDC049118]|uniref:hypothetical protein n=1 Tax=Actinoplanes sp. NPDC049118 TaxID=3155769 RepID=UPI00340DE378
MAITAFPFDDQDTTEAQFSQWARELQDNGVADSIGGTGLRVSDGGGMAVQVQPGSAFLRGHFVTSTAVETVTIPAAGTSSRVDRVVMRINPSTNLGTLAVLQGTAGSSSAPSLTQTDAGIFEISLGNVTVQANATTIDAAMVTDSRQFTGTRVRAWSNTTRPTSSSRLYQIGFNNTTARWEFWNGTEWQGTASVQSDNASQWGGYELIVSPTQPGVTALTNRIWIQPTA